MRLQKQLHQHLTVLRISFLPYSRELQYFCFASFSQRLVLALSAFVYRPTLGVWATGRKSSFTALTSTFHT